MQRREKIYLNCPVHTGFPKKRRPFSKLKNSPNLRRYNKKGKIIEIIYLKIFEQPGVFYGKPCT